MRKMVRWFVKGVWNWEMLVALMLTMPASYMWAQQMPGTVGVCVVKNWIVGIAGALAVGGIAWTSAGTVIGRNHDAIHNLTEKVPGIIVTLGAGLTAAVFGLVIC
jgi:hypothetical protein